MCAGRSKQASIHRDFSNVCPRFFVIPLPRRSRISGHKLHGAFSWDIDMQEPRATNNAASLLRLTSSTVVRRLLRRFRVYARMVFELKPSSPVVPANRAALSSTAWIKLDVACCWAYLALRTRMSCPSFRSCSRILHHLPHMSISRLVDPGLLLCFS